MSALRVRVTGLLYLFVLFIPFGLYARSNNGFTSGGGIPCFWKTLTGYPCPGCGLTRSLASITNLDFIESVRFNPEGLIITGVAVLALFVPRLYLSVSTSVQSKFARLSVQQSMWFGLSMFFLAIVLNVIRVESGFYPGDTF